MLRNARTLALATLLAAGIALAGVGTHGTPTRALAADPGSSQGAGTTCQDFMAYLVSIGFVFGPDQQGLCTSSFWNTQSSSSAGTVDACSSFWVPIGVFPNQGVCVSYFTYYYKTH